MGQGEKLVQGTGQDGEKSSFTLELQVVVLAESQIQVKSSTFS